MPEASVLHYLPSLVQRGDCQLDSRQHHRSHSGPPMIEAFLLRYPLNLDRLKNDEAVVAQFLSLLSRPPMTTASVLYYPLSPVRLEYSQAVD